MAKIEDPTKYVNPNLTIIGRENWATCHRMLIHDLLDARENKEINRILTHYRINFTLDGGYTMALPRLNFGKAVANEKKKIGRPRKVQSDNKILKK